jgi:hypothetical protein
VHFARNLLSLVPRSHTDMVAAVFRTIFAQPNADVRRHLTHIAASGDEELCEMPPEAAGALDTPVFNRTVLGCPHHRGSVSVAVVGEVGVIDLVAARIEQRGRYPAPVRVDTDDVTLMTSADA